MTVVKAYNDAPPGQKAAILKDVVVIMLHSVTPPGDAESATLSSCDCPDSTRLRSQIASASFESCVGGSASCSKRAATLQSTQRSSVTVS